MKKFLCLLLAASFIFAAVSCSSDGGSNGEDESISSLINSGESTVDLAGKKITEDVSVDSVVTIKNADFGGKTLTINSRNVVLENVKNVSIIVSEKVKNASFTIKNSKGESISIVVKGGSSIVIKDSDVSSISVEGKDSSLVVSGETKVNSVEVKEDGATIKGDENSSVGTVIVAENVETVDISNGKIDSIKAGDSSVINVGGKTTISNSEGGKFIAEETAELPENAIKLSIKTITLQKDNNSTKQEYEVGDIFDFTGLSVVVTYNDNSNKTVALNSNNAKVEGFDSSKEGSCTVSFTYNGKSVEGTISVKISASIKEYKKLLDEGIDLLLDGNYDEGVEKIRTAYNKEKNDETKMYYALAELATISTDKSVANILKNNFGITTYPSTLNALINGEWLKDYAETDWTDVYTLKDSENSDYDWDVFYRVSGTECSKYDDDDRVAVSYVFDEDKEWSVAYFYYGYDFYIKDIKFDENGKYLICKHYMPESMKSKIPDSAKEYDINWEKEKKIAVFNKFEKAPSFNLPDWLKNSEFYKETLIKSAQTTYSIQILLLGNLIHCNPNGANELVDNILTVFNEKFENAKKITASMSENSVLIPSKVISALCLDEALGDYSVRVGKAELNVLISSLQILKATFQWLSSYDLSANISSLKVLFNDNQNNLELIRKIGTEKSLSVRNENAMAASKQTFIESIEILNNSYEYLVSSASEYPQVAKDEVKRYGNFICTAANKLKTCINDGSIFYIPAENPFETLEWNATESNSTFGIDMGKLFTPGYFSNIFEKSGSELKLICKVEYEYWDGEDVEGSFDLPITGDMESFDDVEEAAESKVKEIVKVSDEESYYKVFYETIVGLKINKAILADLFPKLESDFDYITLSQEWNEFYIE